jgi:hypothetical protein
VEQVTPEQRARFDDLVPKMLTMARRAPTQNEYRRRFNDVHALIDALAGRGTAHTPEEWISIAEKAAEGHDKPGIVRMPSMAAVLSGMPPEHKEEA